MPDGNDSTVTKPQGDGQTTTEPKPDAGAGAPPTYDEWFGKQAEPVKTLITQRFSSLEATVKATRDERETLKGRLAEITKTLGKDPDKAKQEIEQLTNDLSAAQRRIEFLEEASKLELECLNPAAAWLVATGKNLFNARGVPDWKSIRAEAPELFGKRTIKTHGGNGSGDGTPPGKFTLNDSLREKIRESRR